MQAIIMAGGKGTRLKPFTITIPKPLVPIDDIPILDVVLRQLKRHGFTDIILSVNYLSDLFKAYFGDGKNWGLNITYYVEHEPMGTAGSLSLINDLRDDFLVMNGDILTTLDFSDLYQAHMASHTDVTISTFQKEINIDLGVLKIENGLFLDYIEKPTYTFDVSMGIYMLNKRVIPYIPKNKKFDMPDLMLAIKKNKGTISCYKKNYFWLDIGRIDDYETATQIFSQRRSEFLPE